MPVARLSTLRFYLFYSPIWIGIVGVVLVTQAFSRSRDLGHMLLGVGLCAPILLWPFLREREVPFSRRYGTKAALYLLLLSFLQNYFGTPLYFRNFGLTYRFPVTLAGNGSPWFLSFMTVAYFATYFAFMTTGLHTVERWLSGLSSARLRGFLRLCAASVMSYFMALCETLSMQNHYLADYFYYANKQHMMFVGSLAYGTLLLCGLLVFVRIDADARRPTALTDVAWQALGVNSLVLCAYEVYAHLLPPA